MKRFLTFLTVLCLLSSVALAQQTSRFGNTITTGTGAFPAGSTFSYETGASFGGNASEFRTDIGLAIGTNVQAFDADLDALAAFSSTGFAVRTASNTWAQRTITSSGLAVTTNGNGVSGNPVIAVPKASAATVITGTNDTDAVTALGNKAALDAKVDPIANSRAARQALVFDGTGRALVNTPVVGSSAWTVAGMNEVFDLASAQALVGNSASTADQSTIFTIGTDGKLSVGRPGVGTSYASSNSVSANEVFSWAVAYTGSEIRITLKGVLTTYTDTIPAQVYGWDRLGSFFFSSGIGGPFADILFLRGKTYAYWPYNYALTAAQVSALFRNGAPAAVDRGGSMTALNTSAFVNSGVIPYPAFSGASTAGFTATASAGNNRALMGPYNIEAGKEYTFYMTTSGAAVAGLSVSFGVENISVDSDVFSPAVGSNTFVLTANKTGATYVTVGTPTAGSLVVSAFSFNRRGTLAQYDAQQRGIGYEWHDVNGTTPPADIIRPASGVEWLLPATTGTQTVRGRLSWSGTHEAKSLLGQVALPPNARVLTITTSATTASSGSGLTLGTTNSAARWVALNTYSTGLKAHTVANAFPAATAAGDLDLVLDPDTANYTGTINVTVDYTLTN